MRINYYLSRHMQAGLNSLGKLSRTPVASIITCLVIGIALALPSALFVVLKNAEMISGSFQQTVKLSLFLKKDATANNVEAFAKTLDKESGIQATHVISPEEGLAELQKQAGFDGTLEALQENPLPWVIVVLPSNDYRSPAQLDKLNNQLKANPLVDSVQLDMMWVKRLSMLIMLAHRLAYALAIFLGLAVLLVVNNTIRSATEQHHQEIEVIKLIGGTHGFIRRPFLYAGMFYGLLGGAIAWLLVEALTFVLKSPANEIATLYSSQFTLSGLNFINGLILLSFSLMLGWIGSWMAVTRHLLRH